MSADKETSAPAPVWRYGDPCDHVGFTFRTPVAWACWRCGGNSHTTPFPEWPVRVPPVAKQP